MQDRIRREIKETLTINNGNFTYDSVKNMKYLEMVLNGKLSGKMNFKLYFINLKCQIE